MIGRQVYAMGYRAKGARGRLVGVLLLDISLFVLFGAAVYSTWSIGGGLDGLRKLIGY